MRIKMDKLANRFFIIFSAMILIISVMAFTMDTTTAKSWEKETVDEDGDVGRYVSLALDNDGKPHLCYYDKTEEVLKYVYLDGDDWNFDDVDTIGNISQSSIIKFSIDVDGEGEAHIGYWDKDDKEIKYSYREDGSWNTLTVDEDISSMMGNVFVSLEVEENGRAHMVYNPTTGGTGDRFLEYVLLKGSIINDETLSELGGMVGAYNDLALDESGEPHVSFVGDMDLSTDKMITHGYREGDDWGYHRLQREEATLMYPSMVIDQEDDPHISFSNVYEFMEGDLYYSEHTYDYWETSQVGKGIGQSSIDLRPDGEPSIAYYHANMCLKYCWHEGGEWKEEVIDDSTTGAGMYNSMEITDDGDIHVAYFDYSNSDLKYTALKTDGDEDGNGTPGWKILPFIAAAVTTSVVFKKTRRER